MRAVLFLTALSTAVTGTAVAADKVPPVREVYALSQYPSPNAEGAFTQPRTIASPDDLEREVGDKIWRARFAQNVDFDTEILVLFEWYGSKFDRLTATDEKDAKGPFVKIVYTQTKSTKTNVVSQVRVFAVPKKVRWVVETEKE